MRSHCQGEIGPGLLWLVDSWRSAVAADYADWQHAARASLSAWQRHHAEIKAVFSQAESVSHLAFSPNGKAVLTGSEDGTAQLWDAATAQPLGPALRHRDAITDLAFSPNGKAAHITCADRRFEFRPDATTSSSPRPTRTARSSNCSREAATMSSGKSSRSSVRTRENLYTFLVKSRSRVAGISLRDSGFLRSPRGLEARPQPPTLCDWTRKHRALRWLGSPEAEARFGLAERKHNSGTVNISNSSS
jgi:WD40 repeat protein